MMLLRLQRWCKGSWRQWKEEIWANDCGQRLRAFGKNRSEARSAQWEEAREVGGAARGKTQAERFHARIEWAGMLRVWEQCRGSRRCWKGKLGGRLRAALRRTFRGEKQKQARSARRSRRARGSRRSCTCGKNRSREVSNTQIRMGREATRAENPGRGFSMLR